MFVIDTNISLFYRLSRRIFWIGIANFVLSPFILLWVILYSFFTYAEVGLAHRYKFSCMFLLFLYYWIFHEQCNELFVDGCRRYIKVHLKHKWKPCTEMRNNLQKIDHSNVLYLFIRSCLNETRGGAKKIYYLKHFAKAALLVVLHLRSYKLYAIKITSKCALF